MTFQPFHLLHYFQFLSADDNDVCEDQLRALAKFFKIHLANPSSFFFVCEIKLTVFGLRLKTAVGQWWSEVRNHVAVLAHLLF